ncbi:MAG: alpha/beta fold hydrolase [Pseudomonadota bacterium]
MAETNSNSTDSILIDALYTAALNPNAYVEFTRIWEERVMSAVVEGSSSTLKAKAQKLDLARHFKRALHMFENYKLSRQTSVRSFLDNRNHAAALVGKNGALYASNLIFDRLFQASETDDLFSVLTPLNTDSALTVKDALRNGAGRTAAVYESKEGSRSVLLIEPLDQHGFSEDPLGIAYLVKSCHAEWSSQAVKLLQQTFGLTEAETRVSELLYLGLRSVDIAERRRRTKDTIRKQIKSILQKTGAKDQVELVGTLAGLLHVFEAAPGRKFEGRSLVWNNGAFHRFDLMETPNGGALQYHEFGQLDGDPFVFIHAHTSSAEPNANLIRACAEQGLRIIAPCKPGVGRSTFSQDEFDPDDIVKLCVALIKHLNIDTSPIAGHGMSGVYAIQAAANYPGVFSAAALYDTGPPFVDEDLFNVMPPKSRQIFWTAKDTPELLYAPFAFAAEAFVSGEEGERIFMQNQFEESKHDTALLKNPDFYKSARNAMADFVSTPTRSVDELRMWVSDWSQYLTLALKHMPVTFVHSEYHDWLSAEMVAEYARGCPGAKCEIMNDTAQLFIFERPDLFARSARRIIESTKAL